MDQPQLNGGGLRLAILDPNAQVRTALERRLTEDDRVAAVASAGIDSIDALGLIADQDPHVVLIDPRGNGGTELLAALLQRRLESRRFIIAVHVSYRDAAEEAALLSVGCSLYLLKGLRSRTLVDTLLSALSVAG